MLSKKITLPIIGVVLAGSTILGTGMAYAQSDTSHPDTMITKLSQKFNLDETEVKKFFADERAAHKSQMRADLESKLTQAVKDNKITLAQKEAIVKKLSEVKGNKLDRGSFGNLTEEQRKAEMDKKKSDMDTFLQVNGLTKELLQSIVGFPGHGFKMKP